MKNFAEKILKIKLIATCVSIAKVFKRSKVTGICKGDTTYTQEDLELAEKWRKFLSGDDEQPKICQLSLF